eukprot:gene15490-20905_t
MLDIIRNNKKVSKELYLLVASLTASLCGVIHGFLSTQSELLVMNPLFLSEFQSSQEISTASFSSKYQSIFYFGEMFGALISFFLSDMIGRKSTLIYTSSVCLILLFWTSVTTSSANLLTIRFGLGVTVGCMMAIAPVFTAEVSTAANRGQSIGFISFTYACGSFCSAFLYYLLQSYNRGWRFSLLLPMIILIAKILLLNFIPESPRWLLAQKTPAECLLSMRQLRRTNDVSREFNSIYKALTSDARLGDSWVDLFYSRSIRIRIIISIFMQIIQQFVGIQIITEFGYDILQDIGVHSILTGLLLTMLAAILGSLFMLYNIDILGRKFLLLFGCGMMSISWSGASLCAYLGGLNNGKAELYFTSYILSLGPISWILPAEIFPLRARAKASSVTTFCHFLTAWLGASILEIWLKTGFSTATCLLILAILVLFVALLVYLIIPETKGLMMEDMEELFRIDQNNYCCGCCPSLFQSSTNTNIPNNNIVFLGHRSISVLERSAAKISTLIGRTHNNNTQQNNLNNRERSPSIDIEPNSLHKYSNYMRETQFNYFQEEDEPLVPSFSLTNMRMPT